LCLCLDLYLWLCLCLVSLCISGCAYAWWASGSESLVVPMLGEPLDLNLWLCLCLLSLWIWISGCAYAWWASHKQFWIKIFIKRIFYDKREDFIITFLFFNLKVCIFIYQRNYNLYWFWTDITFILKRICNYVNKTIKKNTWASSI
jgi:hypothetical protein